jgi:hypothetical protein
MEVPVLLAVVEGVILGVREAVLDGVSVLLAVAVCVYVDDDVEVCVGVSVRV